MAENILDSVGNIHKLKSFSCLDRELPCCIPIPPPMSTTAYVLINGIISTNLHFMKSTADAASCGCRLFQPTVVERQQTRCVYVGCNSLIVLEGQVYLFFKTLRKNRCLACNSFPHHWNKAEYSGDAPDDDDLDYNQHFIVIHSQPIIILIGVHWFIKFKTQSTLNLVVREILVSSPAPTDEKQGASKSWIWVERS